MMVTKNCAFGYMLDEQRHMVIDQPADEIVRLIFEMYVQKKGLSQIAEHLYRKEIPTPTFWKGHKHRMSGNTKFQCVWGESVILGILRDEQYLGTYVAGKTRSTHVGSKTAEKVCEEDWIRIPDHHPAIISQELFDTVQAQIGVKGEPLRKRDLNTKKLYEKQTASALKGKVICGHCNHAMIISCTKNAAFHCHFTRSAPDAACHHMKILRSELETVVLESIKRQAQIVLDTGLRADDIRALHAPAAVEYLSRIENLRDEKQRLYESLVMGDIDAERYKERNASIEAELQKAQRIYDAVCSEQEKSLPDENSMQAARVALDTDSLTEQVVDLLVERVLVFPDNRIEIVWKLSGFMCYV
jgi:hypothetical protein